MSFAFFYGLLVSLLLPAGVAVLDDDFGYLRSVIQTLQHGRPWTDDWLEPWAASFSLLSASFYRLTGSFTFATHGLLAVLAALSCGGVILLFRDRGLSAGKAFALAALTLTFPTLLWKTVQFTGMALYIPCLLFALWAQAQRRWSVFALAWILALASRQSAVAWGLMPLLGAWSAWRETPSMRKSWLPPLIVIAAGVVVFFALERGMNVTHSQSVLTEKMVSRFTLGEATQNLKVGLSTAVWVVGLGALFIGYGSLPSAGRPTRLRVILVVVLGILGMTLDLRSWVIFEHTLLADPAGRYYAKLVLLIALLGWLRGVFRVRRDHLIFAGGALALVCLRPTLWDYYLLDVGVIMLFAIEPSAQPESNASFRPGKIARRIAFTLLLIAGGFHLSFVFDLKAALDRAYALEKLSETALREGRLRPEEISFTPFGFIGWQLHPHYRQNEGAGSPDIAGFGGHYLRMGAVEVGQGYSRPLHIFPAFRHVPPSDRSNLVRSSGGRFLWFFQADYFLLRFKTAEQAPVTTPLRNYERPLWPLNDQEWRQLIDAPARRVPSAAAR